MANKIIQLKDSQGNNLYPVMTCNIDELASGTGIEKRKLLWNATPTSSFASQTIPGLDASGYDAIEIITRANTPDATPALYTPIGLNPQGYPKWSRPTGAHDAYNTGDIVDYNGTLYKSLIDGNVYSPEEYPAGWEEV